MLEPGRRRTFGSRFWGPFHYVCAAVIGLAIAFVAVTKALGIMQGHSLLIGEVIAVLAFGTSWLAKGSELRTLWPRGKRPEVLAERVGGDRPGADDGRGRRVRPAVVRRLSKGRVTLGRVHPYEGRGSP